MRKSCFLFIILLLPYISFAQKKVIDSLLTVLETQKEDTNKVNTLNKLSFSLWSINPDDGIKFGQQAILLAHKLNWKKGEIDANGSLAANFGSGKSDYPNALKYYFKNLSYFKTTKDKSRLAITLRNIGDIYSDMADYSKALDYCFRANKINADIGNLSSSADDFGSIGMIYRMLSEYPKALEYQLKELKIKESLNLKNDIGGTLVNIGNIYSDLQNHNKANENYFRALKYIRESGNKIWEANCLANIGGVYYAEKEYENALKYYFEALNVFEKAKNKAGMAQTFCCIGLTYGDQGNSAKSIEFNALSIRMNKEIDNNYLIAVSLGSMGKTYLNMANKQNAFSKILALQKAKFYTDSALVIVNSLGALDYIFEFYLQLSEIQTFQGNYKDALENFKNYTLFKDSVHNAEKDKKLTQLAMNYDFEKREQETKLQQEKKDAIAKEEIKKQKLVRNSFMGGFRLLLMLTMVVIRAYHQKQKANIQLEEKNKTIELQKIEVEHKNEEITSSIEYALRIQTAILPPQKIVKQYLENSFILYKPKDIVAGDFYWMETVDDLVLFAACDCTGHGVPGAMVSVVCHNALTRAVKEFGFIQPSKILDKTTEIVLENFSKSEEEIHDGMDISICSYNTKTKTLEWAGANNSLLLINNGQLTETKADKQCIGFNDNVKPFTNHQFNLQPDTSIYLFTDGYADQFGGLRERKLTKNRFRELLLSIQHFPIQQQVKELDEFITNYKKDTEQTDDILVIGVRV